MAGQSRTWWQRPRSVPSQNSFYWYHTFLSLISRLHNRLIMQNHHIWCLCNLWLICLIWNLSLCYTGEQATRLVVSEGRKIANSCPEPQRTELLRLCDETEILTNQLADLIRKGQVTFLVSVHKSLCKGLLLFKNVNSLDCKFFRGIRHRPELLPIIYQRNCSSWKIRSKRLSLTRYVPVPVSEYKKTVVPLL